MAWNPDTRSARTAMKEVPESDRKFYRGVYVREGEFVGIHCKICGKKYGDGHDRYCLERGVRQGD